MSNIVKKKQKDDEGNTVCIKIKIPQTGLVSSSGGGNGVDTTLKEILNSIGNK